MLFQNLLSNNDNCAAAAYLLLRTLDVRVTRSAVTEYLRGHPHYPSLLSISDLLTTYGIDNIPVRTQFERLQGSSAPILVQLRSRAGRRSGVFTVVKEVHPDKVACYDVATGRWRDTDKAGFEEKWTGIALLTAVKEGAGEKDYKKNSYEEKKRRIGGYLLLLLLPVLSIIAVIIGIEYAGRAAVTSTVYLSINLAGVAVSALLVWYDLDRYHPLLRQICTPGKKINCEAVLHSKGARLAGISWSIIGFTYFAAGLLSLLVSGITSPNIHFILSWLNVLAICYILFSIFYQWRVVRQWCILCIGVLLLLTGQFFVAFTGGWYRLPLQTPFAQSCEATIVFFSVTFAIINLLYQNYKKKKENSRYGTELARLKHDPEIFKALLEKQKTIAQGAKGLGIMLGNPGAGYKIVKICNPYCGPCARAHPIVEDLLRSNEDIQIQIIFFSADDENAVNNRPIRHLLAIAAGCDEATTRRAMNDWYNSPVKDYKAFAEKYRLKEELHLQNEKLNAMYRWCKEAGIVSTPTFFVNGYRLPEIYKIEDLRYLVQ